MNRKEEHTVRFELDPQNTPPLTEKQKVMLESLVAKPDSEIDYSDIPQYRPTKEITSVRIDSDVLVWLRAQGKGYQTRINAILRREMLRTIG